MRGRSLLPCAPPHPSLCARSVGWTHEASKTRALRTRNGGAGQSRLLTKKARGGGGGDHSLAGATGRAPPLPVSSTNGPEQLCLHQGEAATLKNKPQRRNFPGGPGRLLAPPLQGAPGLTARGWEGTTSPPCLLSPGEAGGSLAALPPAPVVGRPNLLGEGSTAQSAGMGAGRRPRRHPAHTPPGLGSRTSGRSPRAGRAPTVLTQLLGEDLLKGHLAPVLQVLLHDAADAERHRGRGDLEPPRLLSGLLALLPWKVAASSPRIQSGGHCWWVSSLPPRRQPPLLDLTVATPERPEQCCACLPRLCPPQLG